ncbi:MAG: hypothetical protein DMF70_07735, partial [Acidobacteria bacterium]
KRRVRNLEKQSIPLTQFALALRKELAGATLSAIEKASADRVVRFRFAGRDELDQLIQRTLIAQLTGRSANLFLLDAHDAITHQFRSSRILGQRVGDKYQPPKGGTSPTRDPQTGSPAGVGAVREGSIDETLELHSAGQFDSLSAALDHYYNALMNAQAFDAHASAARADL